MFWTTGRPLGPPLKTHVKLKKSFGTQYQDTTFQRMYFDTDYNIRLFTKSEKMMWRIRDDAACI